MTLPPVAVSACVAEVWHRRCSLAPPACQVQHNVAHMLALLMFARIACLPVPAFALFLPSKAYALPSGCMADPGSLADVEQRMLSAASILTVESESEQMKARSLSDSDARLLERIV